MESRWSWSCPLVAVLVFLASQASASSDDFRMRQCLKMCGENGCVGQSCLPSCQYLNGSVTTYGLLEKLGSLPVHKRWNEWICRTECHYHCMLSKETEEAGLREEAIGYHPSWCLARVMVNQQSSKDLYIHLAKSAFTSGFNLGFINEPASVIFSALNLLGNIFGLLTFIKLVHFTLPSRPISCGPYYPFAGLWTIYGVLSTTYWLAQCIFHSRNMAFDKNMDTTLEAVLAGYTLILAVVRVGEMRSEQARVVVLAPTLAFLVPHLTYINFCIYDYGLNMQVCMVLGTIQYILWVSWAAVTQHPAQWQLWLVTLLAPLTLFLRMSNSSYMWGGLDSEALWVASAFPSTIMWWSFATRDAAYQTKVILKKRNMPLVQAVDSKKLQ